MVTLRRSSIESLRLTMFLGKSSVFSAWWRVVWPVCVVVGVAIGLGWVLRERGQKLQHVEATTPARPWVNSLGMEFALIPAGEWTPLPGQGLDSARKVPVAAFYFGKIEVTQDVWTRVMGSNPSQFRGSRLPVEQVSWFDAQEFVQRLNKLEDTDKYRLPTEIEWEYAARAGAPTRYFYGDDASLLGEFAWFGQTSNEKGTRPTGRRKANAWGLFDIYGNVWEWTLDCWTPAITPSPPRTPLAPRETCSDRVLRGGGWNSAPDYVGTHARGSYAAKLNDFSNGVRIVRSVER